MDINIDKQNLLEYVSRSVDEEEEFHFLRFESLQRLNIVRLQLDLVRLRSQFQREKSASAEELDALKIKLHDYGKEIQVHR